MTVINRDLQLRWAEAVAWCGAAWCRERLFRTPALRPRRLLLQTPPSDKVSAATADKCVSIVDELAAARSRSLAASGWTWDGVSPRSDSGRLLLFRHHRSLCDGAAREQSADYFDDCNEPPWDTWLWYEDHSNDAPTDSTSRFLVSWVPTEIVDLVDRGVVIVYDESLGWANDPGDKWGHQLIARLREERRAP